MGITIFQVDAFTSEPFKGNPAGVCVLDSPADEEWMQAVAAEMNIAETSFLFKKGESYNIRWFTPTVEVDLCGHATLASAHILWETGLLSLSERASFDTKSGILTAEKKGDIIELDFPREEPSETLAPEYLLEALKVKPLYIGKNNRYYIIELKSESELLELKPDYTMLKKVPVMGNIVTSKTDREGYDFVSRFFAPLAGIDEDPATGSAHCCLGPYWEKWLGKKQLKAYQASSRGAEISVRTEGDRVVLGGSAVTVLRCELIA